ncbi:MULTISPECIES: hypothetical protein [unclassified Streptomyces]|uniref:hypothetical protein n=1 Tax=unclassified Streptomyces TaxID=2593676 RepID=UPI0009348ADF|nr:MULTISPECIES: hypothetical protein [unclassified Streptomyces]QWQ40148.1 hypothetical protein KME66_03370 [Streptomyces sp. YPW6]
MTSTSTEPTPARPLVELNAKIRALVAAGGVVSPEGRREYERLLVEWVAAVRGGGAEAVRP